MKEMPPITVLDTLVDPIRKAAVCSKDDAVRPAAVLWTDGGEERTSLRREDVHCPAFSPRTLHVPSRLRSLPCGKLFSYVVIAVAWVLR